MKDDTVTGEFVVMISMIAFVLFLLTLYWRTPESAGGNYGSCNHPCVEITMPWAAQ